MYGTLTKESTAETQYFADANATAVRAGLGEEMNRIIKVISLGELLAEEEASCLVSSLVAQLHGLPHVHYCWFHDNSFSDL